MDGDLHVKGPNSSSLVKSHALLFLMERFEAKARSKPNIQKKSSKLNLQEELTKNNAKLHQVFARFQKISSKDWPRSFTQRWNC